VARHRDRRDALVYASFVAGLVIIGSHSDARALAGFIPDCVVLFRRLLAEGRVPRWRKALVLLLIGYLALPFDLVPDFHPRRRPAARSDPGRARAAHRRARGRAAVLREHWPGPDSSRSLVERVAYGGAGA
jgi:hypothetical protein